ncbi:NAD(P)/FAD-dependent oxidoreductase [Ancylobacter sp. VNQ12]|uniref:NAD(P)/FAD-dependent oxidoreductase n=1 Tax=Ancylobacter sp. VNQ12 TaxID=3400920 RepID=UPI003C015746
MADPLDMSDTLDIAVIGAGISGMSAAWLLSKAHRVTLFEANGRLGGHSHTTDVGGVPVDTGFIVYNEKTYPNLTALFRHLGVVTAPTEMSLSVSLDEGRLEYSGTDLGGLFAQPGNALSPRFWTMLRDLTRFYRLAPRDLATMGSMSLDAYLAARGFSAAFRDDHLLPMAAAIWSTPADAVGRYPAASFVRFCVNHGLLQLTGRPVWRTVDDGSRAYVNKLMGGFYGTVRTSSAARRVIREAGGVTVVDGNGAAHRFDHVVIAAHADEALGLIADPTREETALLGAIAYRANDVVLHSDARLMPKRRRAWAAWNYMGGKEGLAVTYWMNRLQHIPEHTPRFVTLNPIAEPAPGSILLRQTFAHPQFDARAIEAQTRLWSLQGQGGIWFCGAYFGSGFHEDGLQAGLAVAEQLGGVRRPWQVEDASGRIHVGPTPRIARPSRHLEAAE